MVKQPQSEQTPFTMSSEDFPALPGTAPLPSAVEAANKPVPMTSQNDSSDSKNSAPDKGPAKKGIITYPEGKSKV